MTTSDIYSITYDVIIVGGGVTGAGTARDCAMRGLKVLLVERNDYSTGATGRNHGLMHSGARYAVTDGESAAECIAENRVMRTIARHCIEPTDGLFITLPDDDLQYQDTFVTACRNAGIDAQAIDPAEALQLDPAVNPNIIGAVRVPDASIDPFRLTVANLLDARLHGAVTLNYHEVEGVVTSQGRVEGVKLFNKLDGTRAEVHGHVVVNAAGIWGHRLASMAGVDIPMFPARGALLIFGPRINRMVINRCRKPSNGDILVPDGTVSVLGTTSDRIPIEAIDDMRVTREEVDTLLTEGAKLSPQLTRTRIIRAYAGVRPLVASDDDPSGRSISRGIVCLDHAQRDGLEGLVTITGGKMITYRLMAQAATDTLPIVVRVVDTFGNIYLRSISRPYNYSIGMENYDKMLMVGDLNGDGEINIADVNVLIDILMASGEPSCPILADSNADGEINIADINKIIDLILES